MNRAIVFSLFLIGGLLLGGTGVLVLVSTGLTDVPTRESTLAAREGTDTSGSLPRSSGLSPPGSADEDRVANSGTDPVATRSPDAIDPSPLAKEPAELCHMLAAHPDDPQRTVDVGVADSSVEPAAAVEACSRALLATPDDPLLNFELGRALGLQGLLDEAADSLLGASQAGHAAASAHYAQLYLSQPGLDIDTLGALQPYLELALEGGYEPAREMLAALDRQIEETRIAMLPTEPEFDASVFQNPEIMQALYDRNFTRLDGLTSGFYLEDYGVPKTFSDFGVAFATQLNAPYPIFCPGLLKAGVAARIKSDLEVATSNMALRNPSQGMNMTLDMLSRMFGNGNSTADVMGGFADLNNDVSRGVALTGQLAEQGTKDALTLMQRHTCEGTVPRRIAENLADYVFGKD